MPSFLPLTPPPHLFDTITPSTKQKDDTISDGHMIIFDPPYKKRANKGGRLHPPLSSSAVRIVRWSTQQPYMRIPLYPFLPLPHPLCQEGWRW